jgi:hypothetical protein
VTVAQRSSYLTALLIAVAAGLLTAGVLWSNIPLMVVSMALSVGALVAMRKGWLNRNNRI